MSVNNKGMISQMDTLSVVTGDEFLEVVARDSQGRLKNFKVLARNLRSTAGLSAYEVAVANGFIGTETEWLESLHGRDGDSAYDVALEEGFVGTAEEWLLSLKGADGKDGMSAYELALANGFTGTVLEWLESLRGPKGDHGDNLTAEGLQALLNLRDYEVKTKLRVTGSNSGVVANAAFANFLMLFDKRLENVDNSSPDKVPQRATEMGRMEAEGYSYWKIAGAPSNDGRLSDIAQEIRMYDEGQLQFGSMQAYIQFDGSSKITVVNAGVSKEFDLATTLAPGKDGKSAYELAIDEGFVGTLEEWLQSLVGPEGASGKDGQQGEDGVDGLSAYALAVEEGFVGTVEEWLESLKGQDGEAGVSGTDGQDGADGKSAFQIAVENGYEEGEAEWLKSLEGPPGLSAYEVALEQGFDGDVDRWLASLNGEPGVDGKSAYEYAIEGGYEYDEERFTAQLSNIGSASAGVSGGVFITDIKPQSPTENIGDKVKSDDEFSLVSCKSTTGEVEVSVVAITGHTNFRPNVNVNGVAVTLTQRNNAPMWHGTVALTLAEGIDGVTPVFAVHEDGATAEANVTMDSIPTVVTGVFSAMYPAGQTELKAGDTTSVTITTDQPVVGYEISNAGALVQSSGVLTEGVTHTLTNLVIADRGNTAVLHGFSIRVKKSSGAWSGWFTSRADGDEELVNVVMLNNLKPSIVIDAVNYPDGQAAIKAGESATVNNTVTNFDSLVYASPNGQLTIGDPTTQVNAKVVDYLTGSYNDSTNNLTITAKRNANGSTTVVSSVVTIANVAPVLSVTLPAARLRSGGSNGTQVQKHTVTLTSTQALLTAPAMNLPSATWEGNWISNVTGKVWTRVMLVNDTDAKGTFDFNSVVATSLSGVIVNELSVGKSYVLGGFVFRVLSVPAYPNREVVIGTEVVNTTKLRCTNLSKGGSGSLNFTYVAEQTEGADTYTVVDGTRWYNCDGANATSNTTGLMRVELEEVV